MIANSNNLEPRNGCKMEKTIGQLAFSKQWILFGKRKKTTISSWQEKFPHKNSDLDENF